MQIYGQNDVIVKFYGNTDEVRVAFILTISAHIDTFISCNSFLLFKDYTIIGLFTPQ